MDDNELALLFSANRAYFLVDMEVPSAYVDFLRAMLPDKTASELYTMVGLQKRARTLFFRDFLHHLAHSRDRFIIAPGIRGLVMSVFTLPSYPYVFKVIRDRIAASKDTTGAKVKQKYALVKHHDRAGRMTDILEYSDVAFPRDRFAPELLDELRAVAPSQVEEDGDRIIIRHLYIERRMTPLNIFIASADEAQRIHAVREYGDAIRELATVNIFAGDLLFKNFGVTRYGRVVFYDYDEIEYLVDCRFRRIPPSTAGVRRNGKRRLVPRRAARCVSRGIRDLSSDRSAGSANVSRVSSRAARRAMVAGCASAAGARRPRRGPFVRGTRAVCAAARALRLVSAIG
jgi:isocitrate dehydrogenase kinase/phosphatase